MRVLRFIVGAIMLLGFINGAYECNSIESHATTIMQQIYGVATGAVWFAGAYVLARGIEVIVRAFIKEELREEREV